MDVADGHVAWQAVNQDVLVAESHIEVGQGVKDNVIHRLFALVVATDDQQALKDAVNDPESDHKALHVGGVCRGLAAWVASEAGWNRGVRGLESKSCMTCQG